MNWVERRANKEQAISANAKNIWETLARALKDAVISYNRRYLNPPRELVDVPEEFSVKKNIDAGRDGRGRPGSHVEQLRYRLEQDGDTFHIKSTHGSGMWFIIDADERGRVFLRQGPSGPERSIEEASQDILEEFLFKD